MLPPLQISMLYGSDSGPSVEMEFVAALHILCVSSDFQLICREKMASSSRPRGGGVGSDASIHKLKRPRFCKFMLSSSFSRGKIEIPPLFARKYGGSLSNSVVLKLPNDDAWLVELEQAGGKLWLGEGWKKFQDHYLEDGSFLVFQLEANVVFHVLIFGRSGTEIKYPVKSTRGVRSELTDDSIPSETADGTDESLAETEAASDAQPEQRGPNQRLWHFKRSKPGRPRVVIEIDDSSSASALVESKSSEPESRRFGRPRRQKDQNHPSRGRRGSSGRVRSLRQPLPLTSKKTLAAAKQFEPKGLSFVIQMRRSYMRSGGVSITKRYMMAAEIEEGFHPVELRRKDRSWHVKMLCYPKEHRGKLCRGFSTFLHDNGMRVGDACVFELLRRNVFYVHLFRCSSYG